LKQITAGPVLSPDKKQTARATFFP